MERSDHRFILTLAAILLVIAIVLSAFWKSDTQPGNSDPQLGRGHDAVKSNPQGKDTSLSPTNEKAK